MAVDFCDYFWGEKHDGFQVLYQNMKSGLTATKDLTDAVRETALMQENTSKVNIEVLAVSIHFYILHCRAIPRSASS